MAFMNDQELLREASHRTSEHLLRYGMEVVCALTSIGFRCFGQYGADRVTRYLPYNKISEMEVIEKQVLSGLSS